jgi:hypothetical protein
MRTKGALGKKNRTDENVVFQTEIDDLAISGNIIIPEKVEKEKINKNEVPDLVISGNEERLEPDGQPMILVFYFNPKTIENRGWAWIKKYQKEFSLRKADGLYTFKNGIIQYFLQNTDVPEDSFKLECLNPTLITKKEYKELKKLLDIQEKNILTHIENEKE